MALISSTLLGQENVPSDFNKELQKYYDKNFPTISTTEANKKLNQANVYFLDERICCKSSARSQILWR